MQNFVFLKKPTINMKAIAIHIPLAKEYLFEVRVRSILLILVGVFALGYVYFVSTSVLYVIARKDAHTQIAQVESTIATLESEYFALSGAVSLDEATKLGLVPVAQKSYVTRTTVHASANDTANTGL